MLTTIIACSRARRRAREITAGLALAPDGVAQIFQQIVQSSFEDVELVLLGAPLLFAVAFCGLAQLLFPERLRVRT